MIITWLLYSFAYYCHHRFSSSLW